MLMTLFMSAVALANGEGDVESSFTMMAMWEHAGFIARFVIVTLLLMMVASVLIAIERWIAFRKSTATSMELAGAIVGKLQANDIQAALTIASSEDYKSAYLAAVLRPGLAEMSLRVDDYGLQNAHRAIGKSINEEVSKFRNWGMTALATVASTAPFVGLFGTTFGVINAFQGMATGGGGLASISAGISEALITTGIGIGVAVVGVWLFNYFNMKIDKVTEDLSSAEADFEDWAAKLVQARVAPAAK
jgi:biopolymer transport protein ExbB/TolQ